MAKVTQEQVEALNRTWVDAYDLFLDHVYHGKASEFTAEELLNASNVAYDDYAAAFKELERERAIAQIKAAWATIDGERVENVD